MTRTRCRGTCRLTRTAHTRNMTMMTATAMTTSVGRPSRASHRTPARTAIAATITRTASGPAFFGSPVRRSVIARLLFLLRRALTLGGDGLQAADVPDQLAAGRPGAVTDLRGHRDGQLGHFGQRHRRQIAALPSQLDHLVPFRHAAAARTRRPGFALCLSGYPA